MIVGEVNAAREVIVRLTVQDGEAISREVEAVIDTGFNDELTLPPELITELNLPYAAPAQAAFAGGQIVEIDYFRATLVWGGNARRLLFCDSRASRFSAWAYSMATESGSTPSLPGA